MDKRTDDCVATAIWLTITVIRNVKIIVLESKNLFSFCRYINRGTERFGLSKTSQVVGGLVIL